MDRNLKMAVLTIIGLVAGVLFWTAILAPTQDGTAAAFDPRLLIWMGFGFVVIMVVFLKEDESSSDRS